MGLQWITHSYIHAINGVISIRIIIIWNVDIEIPIYGI